MLGKEISVAGNRGKHPSNTVKTAGLSCTPAFPPLENPLRTVPNGRCICCHSPLSNTVVTKNISATRKRKGASRETNDIGVYTSTPRDCRFCLA